MPFSKMKKEPKEFNKLSQLVLTILGVKTFRYVIALLRYFSLFLGALYFSPTSFAIGLCVAIVLHYTIRDFYPIFSLKEKRLEDPSKVSSSKFLLAMTDSKTTLSKNLEMDVIDYFSGQTKEELESESRKKGFLTVYDISKALQLDKQLNRRTDEAHWEKMQGQAFGGNQAIEVDSDKSLFWQSIKKIDASFTLKMAFFTTVFSLLVGVGVPPYWHGAIGPEAVENGLVAGYPSLIGIFAAFSAAFWVFFDVFINYSNLKRSLDIKKAGAEAK